MQVGVQPPHVGVDPQGLEERQRLLVLDDDQLGAFLGLLPLLGLDRLAQHFGIGGKLDLARFAVERELLDFLHLLLLLGEVHELDVLAALQRAFGGEHDFAENVACGVALPLGGRLLEIGQDRLEVSRIERVLDAEQRKRRDDADHQDRPDDLLGQADIREFHD